MPLSKIHMPETLSEETGRSIGEQLHLSLVETGGVNPDDDFCLISRYGKREMIVHPTFLGERDASATIFVEIAWLRGRTESQKEELFRDFRDRLSEIGLEPNNSIMFLIENEPIDWSFSDAGSIKSVLRL